MEHQLKTLPQYFREVQNGNKTFELRQDKKHYKIGDTLRILEFDGTKLTGQECNKKIKYILRNAEQYGLKRGFVILAMQ